MYVADTHRTTGSASTVDLPFEPPPLPVVALDDPLAPSAPQPAYPGSRRGSHVVPVSPLTGMRTRVDTDAPTRHVWTSTAWQGVIRDAVANICPSAPRQDVAQRLAAAFGGPETADLPDACWWPGAAQPELARS